MAREGPAAARLTSGSDNSYMISQRASWILTCLNTYVASNLVNNRAQLTPRMGGKTLSPFQGLGEDNSHELVPSCLPDRGQLRRYQTFYVSTRVAALTQTGKRRKN